MCVVALRATATGCARAYHMHIHSRSICKGLDTRVLSTCTQPGSSCARGGSFAAEQASSSIAVAPPTSESAHRVDDAHSELARCARFWAIFPPHELLEWRLLPLILSFGLCAWPSHAAPAPPDGGTRRRPRLTFSNSELVEAGNVIAGPALHNSCNVMQ